MHRAIGCWAAVSLLLLAGPLASVNADDLADGEQRAFQAAANAVAKCVVQIRTVGGLDQLGNQALAQGPTTGLIITHDGYIVSSAFSFAQRPTSIIVQLPDGQRRPAELIGRDAVHMLALLKIDVDERLSVPTPAPIRGVRVGDWAVAVGRTYDPEQVNVSVGIVSALNRMHGRAIQTDANGSAANYGGPLVDVYGRVLGVLVPMAPSIGAAETNELAGAEFYDSGIAFAVPLEQILDVLDRWVAEGDLKRGLLGVGMSEGSPHSTPPVVTAVWPRSPAAAADWRPDDVIVAVDGSAVETQTQLRFHLAPRYAGDQLRVKLRRGSGDDAEEIETRVTLAAELPPYRHAFLGILPQRGEQTPNGTSDVPGGDAEEAPDDNAEDPSQASGVLVRAVWPGSPAAQAGIERGDRIMRIAGDEVETLDAAFAKLNAKNPGDKIEVIVLRGDENLEHSIELAELPTNVLSAAELPPTTRSDNAGEATDGAARPELQELQAAELERPTRYFEPQVEGGRAGLLVWLGNGSEEACRSLAAAWSDACRRDRLVLLMPAPVDAKGWSADDIEFLARLLPAAARRFEADPRRIVVAGEGQAGQLAYALAFKSRRWVRGAAVIDSPLPRTLDPPQNGPNDRLAVLSIETQNAALSVLIRRDLRKLEEAGFPATQIVPRGDASDGGRLDAATRASIARWIDGLDRF